MMKASDFPAFKAEVRKALTLNNRTYKDLADCTGYSVNYIYGILSGKECSETALKKIVSVLDLPDSLVG